MQVQKRARYGGLFLYEIFLRFISVSIRKVSGLPFSQVFPQNKTLALLLLLHRPKALEVLYMVFLLKLFNDNFWRVGF
ncbi:hypothetical protein V6Z11_A13G186400 [Gossypium hirsutum]